MTTWLSYWDLMRSQIWAAFHSLTTLSYTSLYSHFLTWYWVVVSWDSPSFPNHSDFWILDALVRGLSVCFPCHTTDEHHSFHKFIGRISMEPLQDPLSLSDSPPEPFTLVNVLGWWPAVPICPCPVQISLYSKCTSPPFASLTQVIEETPCTACIYYFYYLSYIFSWSKRDLKSFSDVLDDDRPTKWSWTQVWWSIDWASLDSIRWWETLLSLSTCHTTYPLPVGLLEQSWTPLSALCEAVFQYVWTNLLILYCPYFQWLEPTYVLCPFALNLYSQ